MRLETGLWGGRFLQLGSLSRCSMQDQDAGVSWVARDEVDMAVPARVYTNQRSAQIEVDRVSRQS